MQLVSPMLYTLAITPTTEIYFDSQNFRDSWAWWYMPVIPAAKDLRQEECKFEGSLSQNKKGQG